MPIMYGTGANWLCYACRSWEAVYYHATEEHPDELVPSFFNISVCQTLTSPTTCNGAHVCFTDDITSYFNLGIHGSCRYSVESRMLSLSFQYSSSAGIVYGPKNVSITLTCGSHLVSAMERINTTRC